MKYIDDKNRKESKIINYNWIDKTELGLQVSDDFTISIGQWWDIYSDVLEELCFGIEHKVNVCYEHALKKEVA